MSDRQFASILGDYSTSAISDARYGNMRTSIALKLEDMLRDEGVIAGEILLVAQAERCNDEIVKSRLLSLVKRLASAPAKVAVVAVMVLGLAHPKDALAEREGFAPA